MIAIIIIYLCAIAVIVAFWIDEYKAMFTALAMAVLVSAVNGDAVIHAMAGLLLSLPFLFVLIPLARHWKRKRQRKAKQNAIAALNRATEKLNASRRKKETANRQDDLMQQAQVQANTMTQTLKGVPLSKVKQKTTNRSREEDREQQAKVQAKAMAQRLKDDPVTAVLRRQVPVRFNETPRSWMGGLPQMPEDIHWPRGGPQNWPMHFAGQVCCADLPAELWRGQGPRTGWLLLFLDGFRIDGWSEKDEQASAVIHIDQLGPEREPPDDLHPVHDIIMSGPSYPYAIEQSDVPNVWRNWPVDIVPHHQEVETDQVVSFTKRHHMPKPITTKELYGVPAQKDRIKLDAARNPPKTWRAALHSVMAMIKTLEATGKLPPKDQTQKLRNEDGWLARLIVEAETALAQDVERCDKFAAELEALIESGATSDEDQRTLKFLEKKPAAFAPRISQEKATLEVLRQFEIDGGEQALSAQIDAKLAEQPAKLATQIDKLKNLRRMIESKPLDTPMPTEAWSDLLNEISMTQRSAFQIRRRYGAADQTQTLDLAVLDPADQLWTDKLAIEHYLDLYIQSPEHRALIPEETLEKIEDKARAVDWDYVSRMGGLPDPVQGDLSAETPALLFQFASDGAMNWMWGDAGAVYAYTTDAELAAAVFNPKAFLECH